MAINKYDLSIINQMVKDLAGRANKPATIKAALHRVYNLAKSDADEDVDDKSVVDLFNRMRESIIATAKLERTNTSE